MIIDNQIIIDFQKKILDRYAVHVRDLPWRKTTDPYEIWISESMLCQTQVNRVVGYYHRWMQIFPTVKSLAHASNEQVLRVWSGLGYNSRALRLKQAAKMIVDGLLQPMNQLRNDDDVWGIFPSDYTSLLQLPWVGDYVANAILAFAYNQDVAVIDTNIRRIMIHQFGLAQDSSKELLKSVALQTLPKGQARTRYNALMDYGALELTVQKTWIKPLTKQSKFEWSTRQVRAGIIKQLLHSPSWIMSYVDIQNIYSERDDLDQVIEIMLKDNLIFMQNDMFSIKE